MALISCRECKKEMSSNAIMCPHCGSAAHKRLSTGFKAWTVVNILGLSIFSIGFGYFVLTTLFSQPTEAQAFAIKYTGTLTLVFTFSCALQIAYVVGAWFVRRFAEDG